MIGSDRDGVVNPKESIRRLKFRVDKDLVARQRQLSEAATVEESVHRDPLESGKKDFHFLNLHLFEQTLHDSLSLVLCLCTKKRMLRNVRQPSVLESES